MAINNINIIQNRKDLSYLIDSSYNFSWESLANLGQRFSIKGDSIVSNSFNIKKTFVEDKTLSYSSFAELFIEDNLAKISIYNVNDETKTTEKVFNKAINYIVNPLLYSTTKLELDKKINGVDYYKENAMMFFSNGYFYSVTIGCVEDLGAFNLAISKYDTSTNLLKDTLQLVKINSIYYLYQNSEENQLYYINGSTLTTTYKDFNTFVDYLFNNYIKEYYELYSTLDITKIKNEIINDFSFSLSSDETIKLSIENISEQEEIYLYPFLNEYYCNYVFKETNVQLKCQILFGLYKKALNDSGLLENKLYKKEDFKLIIPLYKNCKYEGEDENENFYTFNYYCKDTDTFYIYSNETPVSITFTADNNIVDKYLDKNENGDNYIICHHNELDFTRLYKYSVNYNTKYTNIIHSIDVSTLYTAPYIVDKYWVVNDIKTNVIATGKNAGNPNIIFVYTNDISKTKVNDKLEQTRYTILTNTNKDVLNKFTWYTNEVSVYLSELNETISIKVAMPKFKIVDETVKSVLENSIIFNISNIINSSKPDDLKTLLGENSSITTSFTFNMSQCNYEVIKDPNHKKTTLTLNSLLNVNDIVKYYVDKKTLQDIYNVRFSYLSLMVDEQQEKNTDPIYKNSPFIYDETSRMISNNITNSKLSNIQNVNNFYNNNLSLKFKFVPEENITDYSTEINKKYINSINTIKTNNVIAEYRNRLVNNTTTNSYDYLPSYNTPMISLSEVFMNDVNILNRLNILSLNNDNGMYYAYIGTSNTEKTKGILHIGTSNINLNVGIDSLTYASQLNKFNKHNTLSVDFENVNINSNKTISNKYITQNDDYQFFTYNLIYSSNNITGVITSNLYREPIVPTVWPSDEPVNFNQDILYVRYGKEFKSVDFNTATLNNGRQADYTYYKLYKNYNYSWDSTNFYFTLNNSAHTTDKFLSYGATLYINNDKDSERIVPKGNYEIELTAFIGVDTSYYSKTVKTNLIINDSGKPETSASPTSTPMYLSMIYGGGEISTSTPEPTTTSGPMTTAGPTDEPMIFDINFMLSPTDEPQTDMFETEWVAINENYVKTAVLKNIVSDTSTITITTNNLQETIYNTTEKQYFIVPKIKAINNVSDKYILPLDVTFDGKNVNVDYKGDYKKMPIALLEFA